MTFKPNDAAGEALKRQNAMMDRLAIAIEQFRKRSGASKAEGWNMLISHAAHVLAHQNGAQVDDDFEQVLALFVERVRGEWRDHKMHCLGKTEPH